MRSAPKRFAGAHILIPRAQVAREALAQLLVEGGAAEVVVAPAYKTIAPKGNIPGDVPYDLVAFSSSSTATNFFELMGNQALATKVAAIGPITASTARAAAASTWWWNRATIRFPRWLPPSAITSRRSGRQGSLILERWPPWHFR